MEASISFCRAMRCCHHWACRFFGFHWPFFVCLAGDFPLLPFLAKGLIELLAQRFQCFLEFLPNDIDLGVVGDGLEGDVGHPFIDKTLANVATGGLGRWCGMGNFGFLDADLPVSQQAGSRDNGHP